jgi:EmrB/QacA subfamily drug resistance transporter
MHLSHPVPLDGHAARRSAASRNLAGIFAGLLTAMFTSTLAETVTATALPTIVGDLGGVDEMQWVTTAYILAQAIAMPALGRLGDQFGRKLLIMGALAVYLAGSVVCGLAPSMAVLVAGRAVEGLGGGGLIILAQATVADVVPPRQRGSYLGVIGAVFAAATVLGPLLGGWFVQTVGWRWIFAFNVPLALAALAMVGVFLPDDRRARGATVDVAGMACLALATGSFVIGVAWTGAHGFDTGVLLPLAVLLAVGVAGLVAAERRAEAPVLPLGLFANRNVVICTLVGMAVMVALIGVTTYLPTYFQVARGLSPEDAGLMMLPMMGGLLTTVVGTGLLTTLTGRYKWMPVACCAVTALGLVLLAALPAGASLVWVGVALAVLGHGIGLGQQVLVLVVQNEVPHRVVGTATAVNNYFRQLGATMGSALVGSLFTARLGSDLAKALPASAHLGADSLTPSAVAALAEPARTAVEHAYAEALLPLFAYLVPLLLTALVLALFVREKPLASSQR